jgi:fatty-acyl-CoA synthase
LLHTGREIEAAIAAGAGAGSLARAAPAEDDVSVLLCTSGTTGKPKAVMVTEANAQATALNYSASAEVGPDSVLLCNMPLFHVVGLFALARTTLQMGATLLVSPRFEAAETVAHIADPNHGVTHYFCAPQMAQMLRAVPGFDPAHFRRLTALQTGGAPHPEDWVRAWLDEGVHMVDGFGMSEAGTVLGMPPGDLDLLKRKAGAAGLPAITIDIRLVDRDGRDVQNGEAGEIWLRGPSVTSGYWGDEAATRAAFQDGWFKSGDAARRDADGFYAIVDRWKDMYVSGGENVYPTEVEAALVSCPGLAEAAIVGVPDTRWGEAGVAFIVRTAGAILSAEHVIAHCKSALASYKAPKSVVFLDSLPRTASGKLQKNLLRQRWSENHGGETP